MHAAFPGYLFFFHLISLTMFNDSSHYEAPHYAALSVSTVDAAEKRRNFLNIIKMY
jgi:hypothetical protein